MRIDSSARWMVVAGLLTTGVPQIVQAAAPPQTSDSKPQSPKSDQAAVYTCPMHPEVTSDKPGKCPKCGMKLVPKTGGAPAPDKK